MIRESIEKVQEQQKIRVIKFNPETKKASEESISNYKDYYGLLECRTFAIDSSNAEFDVYCDDNGLMSTGNIITKIKGNYQPLAGILVFTGKIDNVGNTSSLDDSISIKDIEKLCTPYGITGTGRF